MKINFIVLLITLSFNLLSAQKQRLQKYIEEGRTFEEIYKRADRMVRLHQMEDKSYRKAYQEGRHKKDNQDNDRLRLERWAWYWRDRLNEDGSFPDLQNQLELYKSVKSNSFYRNASVWKHEGPIKNTGGYWGMGRTTHIDFHPSQNGTFYVAAPNGGLWKTTDGGVNYVSLGEDLPQQPVGVVVVDPKNPNNIFISLGEKEGWWQYGLGVYKSTDGGQTWKTTGLSWRLTESKVLFNLIMNPRNSNILLAATNNGLFKTYNGGNSWVKVLNDNYSDVVFMPGDTSVVYAAKNDYWGSCEVFKSTDGGSNFTQVSSFNTQKAYLKFAVTEANPQWLGVNASQDNTKKFFLSTNAGLSFTYKSDLPENLVFLISQVNPQIMYTGYVNVFKSIDGGQTWNQLTHWHGGTPYPEIHADQRYIGFHPRNKNEIYFCNDGGVYRYNETNDQWTELVNNLPITQFYKMALSNTNPPNLIGGSQDNGGFIRRANGTWGNTNGGDAMWQEIDPSNPNIGYTEYWGGTAVYRTTNNFFNLSEINQNIPGTPQGQWVTPFGLNPKNPKTFIIGYHDVFVSYNRGDQFSKLSQNLTGAEDRDLRVVRISPLDTLTILTTQANMVYRTYDYGKNWQKTNLTQSFEITDLCYHTKDTNKVWLSRSGLGNVKVMESKDRGKTWTNATANFVNTPVLALCYDEASNILFAGTDVGVFYSEAGNWDWQYYGTGLPYTSVTDLDIHHQTRKLYVSTYGRGFYSIDLPECFPLSVEVGAQVLDGSFSALDTVNYCVGQDINLRCNTTLTQGTFRWTGPQNLDSTFSQNQNIFIGKANFSKTGFYYLTYTSLDGCVKLDQVYVKVNNNPSGRITTDAKILDCNHSQILLRSSNQSVDFRYDWSYNGIPISDSSAMQISEPGLYHFKLLNTRTNCFVKDSVFIRKVEAPMLEASKQDVNCHGDSTGLIEWTFTGGLFPFTYTLSDDRLKNQKSQVNAGKYTIQVSDSVNCVHEIEIEILEPAPIVVVETITHAKGSNGKIEIVASGGVPPYTFQWFDDQLQIGDQTQIENLVPGKYRLELVDSNQCKKYFEYWVLDASSVIETDEWSELIYPNPAMDFVNIDLREYPNSRLIYQLISESGADQKRSGSIMGGTIQKISLNNLVSGIYILRLTDQQKARDFKIKVISNK
ncbi:MAG: T9SS type A sorting domain-containing protein [Saprospiraceae bacterium]|nr:T9SS type A sorting domain-containing protein [Saprospiraceae bacterium]